MKKYLYLVLVALIATAPLGFTSCGSDDDEDGGSNGSTPSSSTTLKINGVEWIASTERPPVFHGTFDGSGHSGYVFTRFTRKETDIKHFVMSESLHLDINMNIGCSITKGMDFATSTDVFRGGGNSEISMTEGIFGEDSFLYGMYSSKGAMGSAVIVDFKEKEFLTIKFTNFKLTNRIEESSTDNSYETLTIDGTVTYKYTDSLSEVSAS